MPMPESWAVLMTCHTSGSGSKEVVFLSFFISRQH